MFLIKFKKISLPPLEDYNCPINEIWVKRPGLKGYQPAWEKDGYIYKRTLFLTGEIDGVRMGVDDYMLISDKYVFLYYPNFKKTSPKEVKDKVTSFWKNIDTFRNEGNDKKALEEWKKILDEVDEECFVDIDYLKEKGGDILRNEDLKWELYHICPDLVTGREVYSFRGYTETDEGKIVFKTKMPYGLWKKVSKYFERYDEPSDLYDPMCSVKKGTYYTFAKEEVEKIFNEYNQKEVK